MIEILTSAQMRAVEMAGIDSGAATGSGLMERAGQCVVDALLRHWSLPENPAQNALILCGPGNNGGDGFVVARLLAAQGWQVLVCLHGDADKSPADARNNHARWAHMGPVHDLSQDILSALPPDMFLIDALFGTGLTRPVTGSLATLLQKMCHIPWRGRVAVDAPSGLCMDSGRVLGTVLPADLTVSFHRAKPGHYLAQGPECCGAITVADIGLTGDAPHPPRTGLLDHHSTSDVARKTGGHKYTHGHALVLSGSVGKGGAARLAARAALRMGAGVVTLGCPPAALQENACRLDAIMLQPIRDSGALATALQDTRLNTICIGPGLGLSTREAGLIMTALDPGRASVLDADALTLLAQTPAGLDALGPDCVLTPHAGEFARLFPDLAQNLRREPERGPAYSKLDATREAAHRAGCVVLFKGPDTVIAAPDGRCAINSAQYDRAAPWLATAGSGDVLAGMITGLLARGFPPFDAACAAAWLHVAAARRFGPGLIAEDLPDMLPQVMQDLIV
ncbi:NAD(P)H-hydrate dehydratase [Roseinatronobacter alkalisoli]|uniref:Bifunctional NAD(P)H-hydrate repair enzyme n=1 Tax=Roseinatronobacter alkalisoli TaxID=3028235 RepID=A0ABT5T7U7_9RHOB|nr:NAD(P)H-hydrate dehydratase [Roseinatronobacter sp. HJB301]MDD7971204.1 NAD(P)H-hydrate dehydratase [Roseinatronobacter sp. HJB301]